MDRVMPCLALATVRDIFRIHFGAPLVLATGANALPAPSLSHWCPLKSNFDVLIL
jgi:hypothetical protein